MISELILQTCCMWGWFGLFLGAMLIKANKKHQWATLLIMTTWAPWFIL